MKCGIEKGQKLDTPGPLIGYANNDWLDISIGT
jgi:hypothetical protein